ncbi:unnamed protein product [Lactuca saligna]|uniref:Uncharacterized protein n=1 Tax=Lactuca saligna TaxID=75948 RepID=A0AA35ZV57_LACSI|nr:unnamed protein product [Lactuca saligna]
MVVDDTTPNSPADPLETIDVANTPDDHVASDQPIPDDVQYFGDQIEADDYEGFHDLGFMQHVVVSAIPLNVIYLSSLFKGEFTQGTKNDIDSDAGAQLNPRKRIERLSSRPGGGAVSSEVGSSSVARDTSSPQNKSKLNFDLTQGTDDQVKNIFNNNVERQHIVSNLYDQIDRKKFWRHYDLKNQA